MQTTFRQIPKFNPAVFPEEPAEEIFMPWPKFNPWQLFIVLIVKGLVLAYFLTDGKSQKDYFDELSARKEAGEVLPSGEQKDYCELLFQFRDSVSVECVGVLDGINWNNPPKSPDFLGEEWEEVTKPGIPGLTRTFRHRKYRLLINFDKGDPSAPQKADKYRDHWHRLNPNKTGKHNYYLDSDGIPVSKGTKPSHIFPRK